MSTLAAIVLKRIPYDLLSHLLSLQNIHWMITEYKSPLQIMTAHTWTLSIEVWIGLTFLIMLKFFKGKAFKNAMYLSLICGVLYRTLTIFIGCDQYVVSLCPIAHLDAFVCGSLLAISFYDNNVKRNGLAIIGSTGILGIVSCIVIISIENKCGVLSAYEMFSQSQNYLNNPISGNIYLYISMLSTSIIGLLILNNDKVNNHSSACKTFSNLFLTIGNESYTLYLFHWPLLVIANRVFKYWFSLLFVVLFATIISSTFYNRIIRYLMFIKEKEK